MHGWVYVMSGIEIADSALEGWAVGKPYSMATCIWVATLWFHRWKLLKQIVTVAVRLLFTWKSHKVIHGQTSLRETLLQLSYVKGRRRQLCCFTSPWLSPIFSSFWDIPCWTSGLQYEIDKTISNIIKFFFVIAIPVSVSRFTFLFRQVIVLISREYFSLFCYLTNTTASLAAKAKISAHDTTPGHEASTSFLALSMT